MRAWRSTRPEETPGSDRLQEDDRGRAGAARAALAVGLLTFAVGAFLGLGRLAQRPGVPWGPDARAYCRIASQLVSAGTLVLPPPALLDRDVQVDERNVWGTPYALSRGGQLLPKHSLLLGAILAPGFAIGGVTGAYLSSLLAFAGVAALSTFRAALGTGPGAGAIAGLSVFLLTPAARITGCAISVDVFLALLALSSLALSAERRPLAGGLLAGLLLFLRPTGPLLAAAGPLLAFRTAGRSGLLRWGAGFAAVTVLWGAANLVLWGRPWTTSYDRAAVLGAGGWALAPHSARFGGEVAEGLGLLLLDPVGGLLVTAPLVVVALAGLAIPRRHRLEAAGAVVAAALAFLALAPYEFVRVFPPFNFRFAFPLVAAATLPLASLLDAAWLRLRARRTA